MIEILSEIFFVFFVSYGMLCFVIAILDMIKPSLPFECFIVVKKEENSKLYFIRRWAEKIKFKNGYPEIILLEEDKFKEIFEENNE